MRDGVVRVSADGVVRVSADDVTFVRLVTLGGPARADRYRQVADLIIRAQKALADAGKAAKKRHEKAEVAGSRLTRAFDAIRATSDELTVEMIYERIARSEKRKPKAIARQIQRYRKDLR